MEKEISTLVDLGGGGRNWLGRGVRFYNLIEFGAAKVYAFIKLMEWPMWQTVFFKDGHQNMTCPTWSSDKVNTPLLQSTLKPGSQSNLAKNLRRLCSSFQETSVAPYDSKAKKSNTLLWPNGLDPTFWLYIQSLPFLKPHWPPSLFLRHTRHSPTPGFLYSLPFAWNISPTYPQARSLLFSSLFKLPFQWGFLWPPYNVYPSPPCTNTLYPTSLFFP